MPRSCTILVIHILFVVFEPGFFVMKWNRISLIFFLCTAYSVQGLAAVALITVGDDATCDFRTSVEANALQAAVDAVPLSVPEDDLYVIRVALSGTYNNTTVSVENRGFLMEGGYSDCNALSPSSTNTVIDAGGANAPVITIVNMGESKRVTLANLTLQNASGSIATGVSVENAEVDLRRVTLQDNTGGTFGAGLKISGGLLGATVRLFGSTSIINNMTSATGNGGGVSCTNGARLEVHSDVAISNNTASNGGGIYANHCSGFINAGATGFGGLFLNVGFNVATFGGGGVYLDSSFGPTDIIIGENLGSEDPRPLIIENEAAVQGGGIMAVGEDTSLTLRNAVVGSNSSGSLGGGIQARNGALVTVERTLTRCAGGPNCSDITDNEAPRGGGLSVSNATLTVSQTRILDNVATTHGSAIYMQSQNAMAHIENALIVGNTGTSVIYSSDPMSSPPLATHIDLLAVTIADNPNATRVIELNSDGTAFLGRTIVNAGGAVPVADYDGSNEPVVECGFVHNSSMLTIGSGTTVSSTPGFLDAMNGDYRLDITSFVGAVDRCAADARYESIDLDGNSRPFDAPLGDVLGPFDVGAFEGNDIFFADGFEAD